MGFILKKHIHNGIMYLPRCGKGISLQCDMCVLRDPDPAPKAIPNIFQLSGRPCSESVH